MMNIHPLSSESQLRVEAHRFRDSGGLGRSELMLRLFDFLLERSLAGTVPKETEVAQDVFGKDGAFDAVQDASVRVTVYRLRRKLDEFYASVPPHGNRLFIPRGEYRLALAPAEAVPPTAPEELEEEVAPSIPSPRISTRLWAALAMLLLLVSAIGWWVVLDRRNADPTLAALAQRPWSTFDSKAWPMLLVVGDYYIFGETSATGDLSRLVREFSVNSREDLDEYLMVHPDLMGHYVDLDLHYLPTSAAAALSSVAPLVQKVGQSPAGPLRVLTASNVTPGMIKGSNVVYVGYLSGLGILRGPVFAASHFEVGESYDELIDRGTSRHYLADWGKVMEGAKQHRDYGYLASLPGPAGSRMLIVAGTRDAALAHIAQIAADPAQLRAIAAKIGDAKDFEALYEVRTLGNTDLASNLVVAYPVKAAAMWQGDRQTAFPDEFAPDR